MRPLDADGLLDPYEAFVRAHRGVAIAIVGKSLPDPAIALDAAGEAIARAYGDGGGDGRRRYPSTISDDARHMPRAVLEAIEHVFRATLADERVPKRARLRQGELRPATLDGRRRDAIMGLCREPLPPASAAEQVADVLRRDAPAAAVLRRIQGSGLVRVAPLDGRSTTTETGA